MKSNIYKSCAQVTVFSTIEKGLSFLYRIVLSRAIGAEGIGIYQICLTVFAMFLTIASSGVPITVSRLMAKSSAVNDMNGKHAAVTAGIVSTLFVTVPVVIILFFGRSAFSFLFSDERCMDIFMILLPGLILTAIYSVIRGSFWGNKQFLPYSIIELMEDALMVIIGVALVFGVTDPVTGARNAAVAVTISYVFSFVVSVFWYVKSGGKFRNPAKQLKPLLVSATPITAMRTSASVLNSAVAVLLPTLLIANGMTNSEAMSLYGVAIGMAIPMLFIPSSAIGSIAVVVAPELSENFYKGRDDLVKYDVEKALKAAIFIGALIVPILFVLGYALSDFLYASEFCGEIVQRSSFLVLPMCIAMMTNTVLNSMNCEKRTLLYFSIGAAVMLILIVTLTPFIGVYSYVIGLGCDYMISATLNVLLLKKKCRGLSVTKYAVRGLAVVIVACVFGWLFNGIMENFLTPFAQILVTGPVVFLFTAGGLYLFKMFSLRPLKRIISKE